MENFTYLACLTSGVSLLGYSATGWIPDFGSNSADAAQNNESLAYESFEEMAVELIKLYGERPKVAKVIAKNISISLLTQALHQDHPNHKANLIHSIELASAYVLGKPSPQPKKALAVQSAIEGQEAKKELKEIKQILKNLSERINQLEDSNSLR